MQENHWMGTGTHYIYSNGLSPSAAMSSAHICIDRKRGSLALKMATKTFTLFTLLSTILTATLLIVLALGSVVFASSTTMITNSQGGIYFTGSSADPLTLYQDAVSGNIDAGIRLCGFGARYVGGFYAINVSGTYLYSLVTYQSSSNALAFTDSAVGGGCFETTPGFLTISPSQLATPDPDVYKAAFPGRIWTGYDVVANPGTITDFTIGGNDSYLRGNYTVQRSFDYTTRQVTIQTPTVNYQSTSSNFSKLADDASFGIASDRPMVIGVCTDSDGAECSDGQLYTTSVAAFPATYDTDLGAGQVNDQQTSTRYLVINGIGQPFCAGSNLQMTIDDVSPAPSYYSQNLTIQTTITNYRDTPYDLQGGNVPITTAFDVNLLIYNASNLTQLYYNSTSSTNPSLIPSASAGVNFTYPAYLRSGEYTIVATADYSGDIAECNETDNNATYNFYLNAIVVPTVRIDQVVTNTFAYPNLPYWMNISLKNSDNDTLNNATVQLVEVNGLSINAGTQLYNVSTSNVSSYQSGVISTTFAQTYTNHEGNTSFTYVPTYNQLYESQYGYLNTAQHIGSSDRYMTGNLSNGTVFIFIVNNSVTTRYPLYIANSTYNISVVQKTIYNNVTIAQSFDNIYRVFANYIRALIG